MGKVPPESPHSVYVSVKANLGLSRGSGCDQSVDRVCGQAWASLALAGRWENTVGQAHVPILLKSPWPRAPMSPLEPPFPPRKVQLFPEACPSLVIW